MNSFEKTQRPVRGRPVNDPEQTRGELLAAAAELFNTVGYFDTNTNKIARAAGYAPATFYRHFADKKEIFLASYAYWVNVNWTAVEQVKKLPDDAEKNARLQARTLIANHHRWKGYRKNLYALAAIDEEANAFIRLERKRQMERLMAGISQNGLNIPQSSALYSFFSIERALNAMVDGDVAALEIDEEQFCERIVREIKYLETGRF